MLYVGLGKLGKFEIWITTPVFHSPWYDLTLDYYDCLLYERTPLARYYVSLHKDPRFTFINYKYPPKPLAVKKKKNRFGEEEEEFLPDTLEETIYRTEYNSFENRKDMQMPMWRLHTSTINKVMEVCNEVLVK